MNAVHAAKKLKQREARQRLSAPLVIVKPKDLGREVARQSFQAVERAVLRHYTRTPKAYDVTHPANRAAALRKLIRAKDQHMASLVITGARSRHGVLQIKQRGKWVNFDQS